MGQIQNVEQMKTTTEKRLRMREDIPLSERFLMTINEAALYFNIGKNKMYRIASEYLDSEYNFVIQNGNRFLIKRQKFEDFLNNTTAV